MEIGAAILPIYTRTPTLIAMTAAGLDALSDGRFHLGLGASGPQVIEGFHGVPYLDPLGRTREIIEICRDVWRREAPLVHEGANFTLPLPPERGTGLGKPLKIIAHPVRSAIPIWIASLGEQQRRHDRRDRRRLAAHPLHPRARRRGVGLGARRGPSQARRGVGRTHDQRRGCCSPSARARSSPRFESPSGGHVALYVGGMGARGKNFYNELAVRYGFEKEAAIIQDLYLAGNKREAEAAVPEEFLELTTLCGPKSYVKERVAAFRAAGVTHLQVHPVPLNGQTNLELLATLRQML